MTSTAQESDFDRSIYHGGEFKAVEVGFGAYKLLDVIEDPNIRPHYLKLRQMGHVRITVQGFAEQHESSHNSVTRKVWTFQHTPCRFPWGPIEGAKQGTLIVEETQHYISGGCQPGPTYSTVDGLVETVYDWSKGE